MQGQEKGQERDGEYSSGQAAGQMAGAVRKEAVSAGKGAGGAAGTAYKAAKAGMEGSKAAAQIAAGTAAGPWGTAVAAAWSMRHTLFKVLVCICLGLVFIVTLVVSLPSIVFGQASGGNLQEAYDGMAEAVSAVVDAAYQETLEKVDDLIESGGYDYAASKEAIVNYAQGGGGYDVCYILAAYSASMGQKEGSRQDLVEKLEAVSGRMFPVTSGAREEMMLVPAVYGIYKPEKVTVVIRKKKTGKKYRYFTAQKTFFVPDGEKTSSEEIETDRYKEVRVDVPVRDKAGRITGTKKETYYEKDGKRTVRPEKKKVKYLACTIQAFDEGAIEEAFGIDPDAVYGKFGVTWRQAVEDMASALKMTLYGSEGGTGSIPALTDAELAGFVEGQECNAARKHILTTALSLVGKVSYFWGGKSGPGWNEEWGTPKLVTAAGSKTTGTVRSYGLDCSGFTAWVYSTALGADIGAGTSGQYPRTKAVRKEELLPGDLGFLPSASGSKAWNHVLMYAGRDKNGQMMWVHSSSSTGVVLNHPSYSGSLVLRRPSGIDFGMKVPSAGGKGKPLYTIEVDVTHYCACAKCCGKYASGNTASGKRAVPGMVAMSSHYPFGTQIEINGIMYTVEDRGGTGIENDIHRVDIFVPDHAQALRMGRYKTTAKIYRLGR